MLWTTAARKLSQNWDLVERMPGRPVMTMGV